MNWTVNKNKTRAVVIDKEYVFIEAWRPNGFPEGSFSRYHIADLWMIDKHYIVGDINGKPIRVFHNLFARNHFLYKLGEKEFLNLERNQYTKFFRKNKSFLD